MTLEAGTHIRFHCTYRNPDNRVYIQGQDKFENEMCVFWAYAYPAPEDRSVLDCVGTHASEYGVGHASCKETAACIQTCPPSDYPDISVPGKLNIGPCYQKCIVDSCPNAGALIDAQNACLATNCKAECPGTSCGSCAVQKCAVEIAACQNTACE
jgi:hypothetical protein